MVAISDTVVALAATEELNRRYRDIVRKCAAIFLVQRGMAAFCAPISLGVKLRSQYMYSSGCLSHRAQL